LFLEKKRSFPHQQQQQQQISAFEKNPTKTISFLGNDSCGEGREKRRDDPLEEAATKQATAKREEEKKALNGGKRSPTHTHTHTHTTGKTKGQICGPQVAQN